INPISKNTGGHTMLIVTNNKDRNKKEGIELGETYNSMGPSTQLQQHTSQASNKTI
ncbi:25334_t:CDS:1, partial [Gigaspora margarita]